MESGLSARYNRDSHFTSLDGSNKQKAGHSIVKIKEMQSCAAQTLEQFIKTMPGVPFGTSDVVIEFTSKKDYVERFTSLCAQYAPDRPINDAHRYALEHVNFANAIIGREKSAVIIKTDYKISYDELKHDVFHELMHIYCGKTEMDTEHFIDVYGSGHTPDSDPEDTDYDGFLSAGYFIWSEFIAEYYAIKETEAKKHTFPAIADRVLSLLGEINMANKGSKTTFAMMSAYILNCRDIDGIIGKIGGSDFVIRAETPDGEKALSMLGKCLRYLYDHMRTEKPWKITEEFIGDLGSIYASFTVMNSL